MPFQLGWGLLGAQQSESNYGRQELWTPTQDGHCPSRMQILFYLLLIGAGVVSVQKVRPQCPIQEWTIPELGHLATEEKLLAQLVASWAGQ